MTSSHSATYRLYGHRIESDLTLDAPGGDGRRAPDLKVGATSGLRDRPSLCDGPIVYGIQPDRIILRWVGEATYEVADRTLLYEPETDHLDVVRDRIQAQLFGLWLRRRGRVVLHANAVVREDAVLAFAGPTGAGKTTFTDSLLTRPDCLLLSDDLLVLSRHGTQFAASPGLPFLKKRRPDRDEKERVSHRLATCDGWLRAIVVVTAGGPTQIRPLSCAAATLELVRHAHMPRSLGVTGLEGAHFDGASMVAASVPVFALQRGEGMSDLARSTRLVEGILERLC